MSATGMLSDAEQRVIDAWTERAPRMDAQNEPLVSVVIPASSELDATLRTLQSIADVWFETSLVQVIVADDASTDRTATVLPRVPGISFMRTESRAGLGAACNSAAKAARGKYLCFLTSGTTVTSGWLERLAAVAETDASIGAVGPKLLSSDRRLQEAGAVIWRNGSLSSYGRGCDADDPQYNFRRDVDLCSTACLLVRRDLFERIGGFDERYAQSPHEDADLCLSLRSLGYRVVYEPRSTLVRDGVTDLQDSNCEMLREKWSQILTRQFEYDPTQMRRAALARNGGETLLVIDERVPMPDRSAYAKRSAGLMKLMRRARYNVVFLPDDYASPQPYTEQLQAQGIQVLYETSGGPSQKGALEAVLPLLSGAWICGRSFVERYAPIVRMNRAARIIYDTARDRSESEGEVLQIPQAADLVVVSSPEEGQALPVGFEANVCVVPPVYEPLARAAKFAASNGVVFAGNYVSRANVEAAVRLATEIMPRVWERQPAISLTLLGDAPPDDVLELACERIHVPGHSDDVAARLSNAKVFAAPLGGGSGLAEGVAQALSHGLPCVLSAGAARGFDLHDGRDCFIADDAEAFASAIVRLCTDAPTWRRFSTRLQKALKPFEADSVHPMLNAAIRRAFDSHRAAHMVSA